MPRSVIVGTGRCIPERRVRNRDFLDRRFFADYDQPVDPAGNAATIDKFRDITGIEERRVAADDQVASDLATIAAQRAVEASGIDPETLDCILLTHNFGDVQRENPHSDLCPSLSARVKQSLGIANPACIASDLPFGCAGWVQGVIHADAFIRADNVRRALVIGAETLSRVSDPCDRDSMIYADGAGAAVLEARATDDAVGVLAHASRSDTLDHARLLWMGPTFDSAANDPNLYLKMHGRKLYNYALTNVPGVAQQAMERAGIGLGDVAKVFLHQANEKMDEAILSRLFRLFEVDEIPVGVMPMSISWLGNSSVATVPTLLDLVVRGDMEEQQLSSGDTIILAGVGAGMNISVVVYRWP
jgi:3-oxoacyl-[acyl-carrier-protein] synthase-3